MERELEKNPYIQNIDVYTTLHGKLNVEARREVALLRIVSQKGEHFYLSVSGSVMPLSNRFVPHVLLANGHIKADLKKWNGKNIFAAGTDAGSSDQLIKLYQLASTLKKNKFLSKHIGEIYVNKDHEIEMIPDNEKYIIRLGDINDLDKKLENLLAFYQVGLPKVGAGNIKEINLKFNNQVVCK